MSKPFFKKSIKFFLYSFLSFSFVFTMIFLLFYFGFLSNFSSVKLDTSKFGLLNTNAQIFDINNNQLVPNLEQVKNINIDDLPQHVIDAFLSIEDKNFYHHKGVNYKRIARATLKNLTSLKLKEGASTISQQLIKNTHLTGEKTFKRKFDELLLTQNLEKTLSKKEILNAYLNAIYFGNGTFGINQASQRYFSKNASELTVPEGAMLAAVIRSPKNFSPIYEPEKCLKRRNLVLSEMKKDNKINLETYEESLKTKLGLKLNKNFLGNNNYYFATVDEACKLLKISEKDLMLKNYKIYTYKDSDLQKNVENQISKLNDVVENKDDVDGLALILDNKTGAVKAYAGKSDFNLLNLYRQPGSVFKPLIAYAPALEYNIISPSTLILDEKIDINGYSPSNYNSKFNGWTSAKNCLAKSLNIPSVKILHYVGISKAKAFVSNMGISFENEDLGYSLALGGLTKGVKIKDITNCYQAIANNGKYVKSSFIKEITNSDGKIIYKNASFEKQVMRDDTAYLLTDMLKESVKNGTCKKLQNKNFEIAGKTGTVGANTQNNENSDVWNISYTTDDTMCVWIGNTKTNTFLSSKITGANAPTQIAGNIYKNINTLPKNFEKPLSVDEIFINELDYKESNKIMLVTKNTPDRYKIKAFFSKQNLPKETSPMFEEINDFEILAKKVSDNKIVLNLDANKYLWYEIIRQNEDNKKTIATIKNKLGKVEIVDDEIKKDNFYIYYAIAHYLNDNESSLSQTKKSNEIKLFLAKNCPSLIYKNWF